MENWRSVISKRRIAEDVAVIVAANKNRRSSLQRMMRVRQSRRVLSPVHTGNSHRNRRL